MQQYIVIRGARENNLKNISLQIPRNQITAVVGVSGSGKSSLIIDVLLKESMRQLFDTMGGPNQVKKPLVDRIEGLSPVVYIDQNIKNRNPRSTVGTATEVLKLIRLLFAQAGVYEGKEAGRKFRMSDFSYNNPHGACPKCHGIGEINSVNKSVTIDEELSVYDGALKSWGKNEIKLYVPIVRAAGGYYGFDFDPHEKIKDLSPQAKAFLYYGNDDARFAKYFPDTARPEDKKYLFAGFINEMEMKYEQYLDIKPYQLLFHLCHPLALVKMILW